MRFLRYLSAAGLGLCLTLPNAAGLAASLVEEVLDPGHYRALAPTDFISADDYQFVWDIPPPNGVTLSLDAKSLEWMRVRDVLNVPRARAKIKLAKETMGAQWLVFPHSKKTSNAGSPYLTPLRAGEETQIAIPLIAHPDYLFEFHQNGKIYPIHLVYQPKKPLPAALVLFDPSCSRFDLQHIQAENLPPTSSAQWMMIGCQYDLIHSAKGSSANLALTIFWQTNLAQTTPNADILPKLDDLPISSYDPTQAILLRTKPLTPGVSAQKIVLAREGMETEISYKLPPVFRRGNIGIGIGPYLFDFEGGGLDIHRTVAMPTLYASATLTDTVRLVAFEATPLAKPWTSDLGLYLTSESSKFFDRRFSFNLMLGGHVLGFQSRQGYVWKVGFPQGFEIIGTDIFARGYNFALGGFIFPSINGKAYNNLWVRWGTRRLFGEINYILWREDHLGDPYFARSLGLTLGMPLPFLSFL